MASLYPNEHDNRDKTPKAPIIAFCIAILALLILVLRFILYLNADQYSGFLWRDLSYVDAPDTAIESQINEFGNEVYGPYDPQK